MTRPDEMPSSITQKYLNAGYTIEQIAAFHVSVRVGEHGDTWTVTSPRSKTYWRYKNGSWIKS